MNIPHLNQRKLNGTIWGTVLDVVSKTLFVDSRNSSTKKMELTKLKIPDLEAETKPGIDSWWSQLIGAKDERLLFIEYQDQNDPNKYKHVELNWKNSEIKELHQDIILPKDFSKYPQVYEHNSAYHKTVIEFLSLDTPLSCEYFEWGDKIIISYYLRSDTGFERYLLVLKEGKKLWKVKQDHSMKGFSPGAFFVFQNQLIFIKDLNEVCIYAD
ncbi:MAG: hypothetical protein AAFY41_08985 [Bacteroidota bacterium]